MRRAGDGFARERGWGVPGTRDSDRRHVIEGAPMLLILTICAIVLYAAVSRYGLL